MNKTKIEYLTHTWNPIAMRCTPVGAGCANCWHLAMASRLAANPSIPNDLREAYGGAPPVLVESRLGDPLKHKNPARIGIQFMGDLFHEDVPLEFINKVFAVMAAADQHTFLVLTKRPKRLHELAQWLGPYYEWPFPNVQLGISASTQDEVDQNVTELLQIPAAVRFVSMEPMLERMDLKWYLGRHRRSYLGLKWDQRRPPYLNWVIIGCESGPHRRPMELKCAIDLVRQCEVTGVPIFVKQVEIDGRVSRDPSEWPPVLRVREYPV